MNITIGNLRKMNKEGNKTKAFCTVYVEVAEGLSLGINDVTLVEGANGLFVSFPQRPYEQDGETKYANRVFFAGAEGTDNAKEAYAKINTAAVKAYNEAE